MTATIRSAGTMATLLLAVAGVQGGQFRPIYSDVKDPEFKEWQAEMKADRTLESLAEELNAALVIPGDVTLTLGECEVANAFYDPEKRAIVICYELLAELYEGAAARGMSEQEAEDSVTNAAEFFFYHELGHALIDLLELPTTGKEEDAVDQLSTYVLVTEAEEGEVPALDAAGAFLVWAEQGQQAGAGAPFWDEHALDEQRFFNIVCWVYGQDPARFADLVKEGVLPEARAGRCPGEWEKIERSWSTLLKPHLKAP